MPLGMDSAAWPCLDDDFVSMCFVAGRGWDSKYANTWRRLCHNSAVSLFLSTRRGAVLLVSCPAVRRKSVARTFASVDRFTLAFASTFVWTTVFIRTFARHSIDGVSVPFWRPLFWRFLWPHNRLLDWAAVRIPALYSPANSTRTQCTTRHRAADHRSVGVRGYGTQTEKLVSRCKDEKS